MLDLKSALPHYHPVGVPLKACGPKDGGGDEAIEGDDKDR